MTRETATPVQAAVIGGGPAGLMAAETLAMAGFDVTVFEAKPSLGRKFLMAGKSGLNLTKREPVDKLLTGYAEASDWLSGMIRAFDPSAIADWSEALGQPVFAGSTGRVFPKTMKASPLLRAWLRRLQAQGVELRPRHRWTGWHGEALQFETPDGPAAYVAQVTVLALGGASWAKLGSDGHWRGILLPKGVGVAYFAPANAGLRIDWSRFMDPVLGKPLKNIGFSSGALTSRGEAIVSARGLEGGGIYAVSRGVREGHPLVMDLAPDLTLEQVTERLTRARGKSSSWSNAMRKGLRLSPAAQAVLREFVQPFPTQPGDLARHIKALTVPTLGLRPMDEAISTAGGVAQTEVTADLMLRALPGVFCAGEMLDWEAPTGGYLLTGCLATGRRAGQGAASFLSEATGT